MKIIIKKGREKSLVNHHPWIFSGGVFRTDGNPQTGDIVSVVDAEGKFLGKGFYNSHTSIAVRVLTWIDEPIDAAFWNKRLQQALALRTMLFSGTKNNAYRIIHGEADLIPGLTLDYYNGYCVLQIASAGLEKCKTDIIAAIQTILNPKGILERGDLVSRKVEGLPQENQILAGTIPDELEIIENNMKFLVNVKTGQKTGFFLDQRDNRARVGDLAKNKTVLNCFCYSGGFTVVAALQGAITTNIDSSAEAIELARRNCTLNDIDTHLHQYITADVFGELRRLRAEKHTFDMIILDPPAFAKNKEHVPQAAKGYKDINYVALQIIKENGILVTCSCSQHLERMLFQKIVHDAARDAGRTVQLIEYRGQAPDHPINLDHPEGDYLKVLICRVI
jgi:23S rRNA (cytosine1962-C5)-methyltransferase